MIKIIDPTKLSDPTKDKALKRLAREVKSYMEASALEVLDKTPFSFNTKVEYEVKQSGSVVGNVVLDPSYEGSIMRVEPLSDSFKPTAEKIRTNYRDSSQTFQQYATEARLILDEIDTLVKESDVLKNKTLMNINFPEDICQKLEGYWITTPLEFYEKAMNFRENILKLLGVEPKALDNLLAQLMEHVGDEVVEAQKRWDGF